MRSVSSTVEDDCGREKTPLLERAVRRDSVLADLSLEEAAGWPLGVRFMAAVRLERNDENDVDDEDDTEDKEDGCFDLAEEEEDLDLDLDLLVVEVVLKVVLEEEEEEDFFDRFFRVLVFLDDAPPASLEELTNGTGCLWSAARRLLLGEAT